MLYRAVVARLYVAVFILGFLLWGNQKFRGRPGESLLYSCPSSQLYKAVEIVANLVRYLRLMSVDFCEASGRT